MSMVPAGVRSTVLRTLLSAWRRLPTRVRVVALRVGTPRYTVGSLVLLRRERAGRCEFLLLHQRHTGRWALPGGLLKRGEAASLAAQREVGEEVGITVPAAALGAPVGVVVDEHPRRVDVLFVADLDPDTAMPEPERIEVMAVAWHTMDALPRITAVTRRVLDEYVAIGALPAP